MKHRTGLGLVIPFLLGLPVDEVLGMGSLGHPAVQSDRIMVHMSDLRDAEVGRKATGTTRAPQPTSSQATSANGIFVDPTVTISDGIIHGHLQASSDRGLPLTFDVVGDACGRRCGLGSMGGKITLGTVPLSPTSTDPQSFTVLPYAEWLEAKGIKSTELFKVRIREVGKGGASVVAEVLVDVQSLAPGDTPVAFTYHEPSFDGILISTNFYPASGLPAGGEAPTVLSGPGLGRPGSTDPYSTSGERGIDAPRTAMTLGVAPLRAAGYNVVTWDPRGQFNSGGKLQFDNPFFEGRDVSAVISWITDRTPAALDGAGDPKVGMVGGSYGGTIQLTAASLDPRIDAIVPDNAWHSLLDSLYPEKTFKTARGSAMLKSLRATGARFNGQLIAGISAGVRTGRLSPAVQAMLASIGPTTLLSQLRAPTLLTQGVGNDLFPLDQSIASAENIAANAYDTPIKLIWYGAGDGPISADQVTTLHEAALAWLDQHVAGNGEPATVIPKFQWFDEAGGHYTSNKLPFEVGFNEDNYITINSDGGRLIIVPPASLADGASTSNSISVPVLLPVGTQIVGSPELSFTYRGRGTSRAVFAQIIDNTRGRVLSRIATPLPAKLDGKLHTLSLPLSDIAYTQGGAVEGNLILKITGWVPDFANRSSGVITISDIQLDLPQRAQRATTVR